MKPFLYDWQCFKDTPHHIQWKSQLVVVCRMAKLEPLKGYSCTKTAIWSIRPSNQHIYVSPGLSGWFEVDITRICASLGLRMKFKTLCYPVFGRNNFYYQLFC